MINYFPLTMLAVSTLLLAACSSDNNDIETLTPVSDDDPVLLSWSPCPDNEKLDCATLSVPMDYSDEQAGDIELALNRVPALQQPARGVLLVNGGGPGENLSTITSIEEEAVLPDAVRQRFDVIGFDPRGFGKSTPVICDIPHAQSPTYYLTNESMITEFVEQSSEIAEQCFTQVGGYLLQVGSMNVVRDMESIRQALAVEKINFFAASFGTRYAALYLQSYPERSGAFILDASLDPDNSTLTLARDVQPALQKNLESMLAQCRRTEPDCDPDELQQLLINKMNALVADGNQDDLAVLVTLLAFAAEEPELADFLIAPLASFLLRGERAGLDALVQALEAGEDEPIELDFGIGEKAAICADDAFRPTSTDLLGYLQEFNTVSDVFAEAHVQTAAMCAGWPASNDPLPPIVTSTAPASLVIGGAFDVTTPIAWSEDMADAIGGYFLASSHAGHVVTYSGDSKCVDDIVTEFLVDGRLPAVGNCLLNPD